MGYPASMKDIRQKVEANDGICTVSMLVLRNAVGAERIGKYVPRRIQNKLKEFKLGYFPTILPTTQQARVRLYALDSLVGKVIEAAHNLGQKHDDRLRHLCSEKDERYIAFVRQIQKLIRDT